MTRRGFTLLEVSLAVMLAALVMITALGLFVSLDRSDRRFEQRFNDVNDLDKLQTALRRAFSNLAVTDETPPPGTPGVKSNGGGPNPAQVGPASADAASSLGGGGSSDGRTFPAPRLRITEDTDPSVQSMVNRSKALAGGSGSGVLAPQVIELVTAGQPVPDTDPNSLTSGGVTRAALAQGIILNRAAIYVRPSPLDPPDATEDERTWQVLYTRLMPRDRVQVLGGPLGPTQVAGEPIVLASGIKYFNVRVFKERAWTRTLEATYFQHLPAYFQVEVETASGVWAKWIFEVGWLLGPETQLDRDAKQSKNRATATDADGKSVTTQDASGGKSGGSKGDDSKTIRMVPLIKSSGGGK